MQHLPYRAVPGPSPSPRSRPRPRLRPWAGPRPGPVPGLGPVLGLLLVALAGGAALDPRGAAAAPSAVVPDRAAAEASLGGATAQGGLVPPGSAVPGTVAAWAGTGTAGEEDGQGPTPGQGPAGPATWAPPVLDDPVVVPVADGAPSLRLDPSRDYLLLLPRHRAVHLPQGLVVGGGHDVVVVGGAVDVGDGYLKGEETVRRGLYLKGQTGTVHVEGVRFGSSTTGTLTEGVDLDQRLGATVTLQNVAFDPLVGSRATHHADVLQTWAGPDRLQIDGLHAVTDYQGFFLLPGQHWAGPPPSGWDMRRVVLVGTAGSGYLVWRDAVEFPWHVEDFTVVPGLHDPAARGRYLRDPLGSLHGVTAVAVAPSDTTGAGVGYTPAGYASAPSVPSEPPGPGGDGS